MRKLTDDEKILGVKPEEVKTEVSSNIFEADTKFEITVKEKNIISIVTGGTVKNLLPLSERHKFLNGFKEIEYKNFIIKILGEVEETKEETTEPKKVVKKPIKSKRVGK